MTFEEIETLKLKSSEIKIDFRKQESFFMTLIQMLKDTILLKSNSKSSDLEVGFKLGEIYRMMHEYWGDNCELKEDMLSFINTVISIETQSKQ